MTTNLVALQANHIIQLLQEGYVISHANDIQEIFYFDAENQSFCHMESDSQTEKSTQFSQSEFRVFLCHHWQPLFEDFIAKTKRKKARESGESRAWEADFMP
jgi:hypothetical protein